MTGWARSLEGRVALILFAALATAHGLTFWSIQRERADLARSMMLAYVGRDVGSAVAMLDRLPPAERPAWLDRLARQNYRYTLDAPPLSAVEPPAVLQPIRQVVATELGPDRIRASGRNATAPDDLLLSLRLADGSPLTLHLRPAEQRVSPTTLALLLVQLALLGIASWLAVRLATRPLQQLVAAVNNWQADHPAAALPEQGPQEVAQAAAAFNALQRRIAQHLAERLQMLAAIAHDLQSPITRLRLRSDAIADASQRKPLQADLAEMQSLVEQGLAYARSSHAAVEPERAVDLAALLDGLVCDAVDAGNAAHLQCPALPPLTTRPQALKRIVGNLLDNALKFGDEAWIDVSATAEAVEIVVRDRGPGIPPDQLQAVLQPFVRLESSRNRDTGGTGLGLAIADQLSHALGARLSLRNGTGGGLEARLRVLSRTATDHPPAAS
jgi:signal transduction histidine kinase